MKKGKLQIKRRNKHATMHVEFKNIIILDGLEVDSVYVGNQDSQALPKSDFNRKLTMVKDVQC